MSNHTNTQLSEESPEPCPLCREPLTVLTNGLAYCHNLAKEFASNAEWKAKSCLIAQQSTQLPVETWRALNSRASVVAPQADAEAERKIAVRFLVKQGYERCAQLEHGCDGWHERRTPVSISDRRRNLDRCPIEGCNKEEPKGVPGPPRIPGQWYCLAHRHLKEYR